MSDHLISYFLRKSGIDFTKNINYVVGNNIGKTTIFNAIEFLICGGKKRILFIIIVTIVKMLL